MCVALIYSVLGCDLSLFHSWCMSFIFCLTATFYWFLFVFVSLFVFCVARLLPCPSLNVARQSADPWAPKSTKVMLTHLSAFTCPFLSSLKDNLPHCSPASRHGFHSTFQIQGPWECFCLCSGIFSNLCHSHKLASSPSFGVLGACGISIEQIV